MKPIVTYIITLLTGLVTAAELTHSGQAAAGEDKKAFVLSQLTAIMGGPLPVIDGVSPAIVSAVWSILRFFVPMFGPTVIDWVVTKLNGNSFFMQMDSYVQEALAFLSNFSPTIHTQPSAT